MTISPITTTLAALAVAGLLGACGGNGGGEGGSNGGSGEQAEGEENGQALYDWVECMRGEGIEVPDPTRDAQGNLVITGDGWDMRPPGVGQPGAASFGEYSGEEMQPAQEACGRAPMTAPGVRSDETVQQEQEQLLAFAECMREHGIEDFPDPDFSSTGSTENGGVAGGPFGTISEEVEQDPDFPAASETCEEEAFASSEGSGG
jgi:hypothetical protein